MFQKQILQAILLMILILTATTHGVPPSTTTESSDEIGGLTSLHTLTLMCGKSPILSLPRPCETIEIGDPKVAFVNVIHGNPVLIAITAKARGVTNAIIIIDGQPLTPIDVVVTPAATVMQPIVTRNDGPALAIPAASRLFSPRLCWIAVAILPMVALIAFLEPRVRRGKGYAIAMTWIWTWFAIGQICFAWGMAALGHGESIKQVGPMLLASLCVWMAMLLASRRMNRRHHDAELKRMQLMDIASLR
jgi:hypothetical protein